LRESRSGPARDFSRQLAAPRPRTPVYRPTLARRAEPRRDVVWLTSSRRMTDHCIFCRCQFDVDHPRSEEHIWPKWMHPLLPENEGVQWSLVEGGVVGRRRFGQVLHKHFKPRVVCGTCNNTWMSRLEMAVKPILLPLMRREARHLAREDQVILVTWAFLKHMVAEFSDPATRATEPADFDRMRDERLPLRAPSLGSGSTRGACGRLATATMECT
jgi:hypothetical protein